MRAYYNYAITVAETGEAFGLPVQEEALACPQIGSAFELVGRAYGTVTEAATIIQEHPQQDSGDEAWRQITHSIVIGAARKEGFLKGSLPPRDYIDQAVGTRGWIHEYSFELSAFAPSADANANLIAGQVTQWCSLRGESFIELAPGSAGVPGQFGYVGTAFKALKQRLYITELLADPVDVDVNFTAFDDNGTVLASSVVRNDKPGHWIATTGEMMADSTCRFTASPAGVPLTVRMVKLHVLRIL